MEYALLIIISLGLLFQFCEQEDHVWVIIDPVQCFETAWETAWFEENGTDFAELMSLYGQEKCKINSLSR